MTQIKFFSILCLVLLWSGASAADELPDLGERSETLISQKTAKRLGQEFMKELSIRVPIIKDAIINDYIQRLGTQLAAHATTRKKQFHFFVVDDATINAFAGPDAHIGINSGTILATTSESELAAILAHEIAHVTQHHLELLIENIKHTQIASVAGILAAIMIGSATNHQAINPATGTAPKSPPLGELASGVAMASMGGAAQHLINFTRKHEIEADNIGMKILAKAAFDPKAMPHIFEKMQRLRSDYLNDTPQLLLTHPVTNDRIAAAKNRADQYPVQATKAQTTFNLIRARTMVLTDHHSPAALKIWQTQLQQQKNNVAIQYGYALSLYKKLQFPAATTLVTKLQKEYPQEVLFHMLAAELAVANKQMEQALILLQTALITHADYYPLIIQYGQTLLAAKEPQLACDFIQKKIRQYKNKVELYRLLAQAYAQKHQLADAYQAKAKAYALEGYNRQALLLLHQALKISKLSTTDRAIINARIEQLKKAEQHN